MNKQTFIDFIKKNPMNKKTVIDFIKKYPMTILLAIIAINLHSIGDSLKTEADLNRQKLICIKYRKGWIETGNLHKKLNLAKRSKIKDSNGPLVCEFLGS